MKCVVCVKEFGMFIIMYDYFIGGFIYNIIFVYYCCDYGFFFYIYCVMYVVIDCQCNYGIYFCVFVKVFCFLGGDYFYLGIVVGKFEGECNVIFGFVDFMCDVFIEKDCDCGIYFIQDWGFFFGVMLVVFGGIYVWYMLVFVEIFGDDVCF